MKAQLIFIWLLAAAGVSAITETLDLTIPEPDIAYSQGIHSFSIEGFGSAYKTGYPVLPTKTFYYEVPVNANRISVTLIDNPYSVIKGVSDVKRAQDILPADVMPSKSKPKHKEVEGIYPDKSYFLSDSKKINDRKLLAITVYPVRFDSDANEAQVYSSYSFEIEYQMPPGLFHYSDESGLVEEITQNTEPVMQSGIRPSDLPAGTDVKYAIITVPGYQTIVQELADWKSEKGIPAIVYNTTFIYANQTGNDNQEKIRKFLQDLESQYDLDWVLLAGDVADVPTRYAWIDDGEDTLVPTDYYYADLEGDYSPYDWDLDNDSSYAETGDNIDWLPEVYVGRLSAANSGQMQTMVDDIIAYEKSPAAGSWTSKTILAGGKSDETTDEALLMKFIKEDFMDGRLTSERINYLSNYPRDYILNFANFQSRVTAGSSLVTWAGHGSYTSVVPALGQPAFANTATAPSNGDMKPFVYANSCSTGGYDQATCLGEDIIRDWGIGFIGASRVSWYVLNWSGPDDPMNQAHAYRFNEQLVGNNKTEVGKAFWDSKVDYISDFNPFAYDPASGMHYGSRKNLLAYNLLGEPELNVWLAQPGNINISVQPKFNLGVPNPLTVTVSDYGTPLDGALVTITNHEDVYESVYTNASGTADFSVTTDSALPWTVTATMQGRLPEQKTMTAQTMEIWGTWPIGLNFTNPSDLNFSYQVNTTYNISYCRLLVDGQEKARDTSVSAGVPQYIAWDSPSGGDFVWKIDCLSTESVNSQSSDYQVHVVTIDNFDGDSTNLSDVDIENITNMVLEKTTYGKINFTTSINLSEGANINSFVHFDLNYISIDSDYIPALNKPAILTIKGVSYSSPVITRNGQICDTCTIVEIGADYVTFSVAGFSTYRVTGSSADVIRSGRMNESSAGNITGQGGNVTIVNVSAKISTDRWQGFYGNVSGTMALGYNSYLFYSFLSGGEKVVYAVQNSTFDFYELQPANATDIDAAWGYDYGNDQAVDVFTGLTNITGIVAKSVELNPTGENLNSSILRDGGNTTKTNFAFGALVQLGSTCFDGSACDFELMVPANGTEVYYLFLELG